MKYSAVGSGSNGNSSTRWRFKSTTIKAFMITLFAFSAVFITYQLIYYMNLTEYQSQESHSRQLELLNGDSSGADIAVEKASKSSPQPEKLKDIGVGRGVGIGKGVGGNQNSVHFQRGNERKKGKPLVSGRIIGVRPTDLHLYQNQERQFFQCFSTHKQISWNKVNDDYCDCPLDGSDEPSTAACMNGKFYCLRKDGIKDFIPSSRVNDGICDCLDGTDEHAGHVVCKKLLV